MNKKILLIDDSKTQLGTFKIFFSKAGFDVETAEDGILGYKKIFEVAPDLIISDVMMPNINGYQLCHLVKDNPLTKKIPFVLLTILDQKIDKYWSVKSGATKYISKNTPIDDILNTVSSILESEPIPNGIKQSILNFQMSADTLQSELNQILAESLMQSSVMNEFRTLVEYIKEDDIFSEKLFELFDSIVDYDMALFFLKSQNVNNGIILYSNKTLDLNQHFIKDIIENIINKEFTEIENNDYNLKIVENKIENILTEYDFVKMRNNTYSHIIEHEGEKIGMMCFFNKDSKPYKEQKYFNLLLQELDLIATVKLLYNKTKELAVTDTLTGLYNRRYFLENLEREYSRSVRYNSALSVIMTDLDFFKNVNDSYGHQAGDYVLKEVTKLIKNSLRKTDIIFRYGGEEILIIMPETTKQQALIPLERIRELIENKTLNFAENNINITISTGIVDNYSGIENIQQFVEFADSALYDAKKSGRNKVVLYNG